MSIIIGPVTTGGSNFFIFSGPTSLTITQNSIEITPMVTTQIITTAAL